MALRDHPYLPLFVQDFLTDEKLIECSASANGVYIRLLCLMHKSDPYGKILLKQNKSNGIGKIEAAANKLAKAMPYDLLTIKNGLEELLEEKVVIFEQNYLVQKRMVRDNEISLMRSESGKLGAEIKRKNNKNFAIAKPLANTEYEYEYDNTNENVLEEGGKGEEVWNTKPGESEMNLELNSVKAGAVKELFLFSKNLKLTDDQVESLWRIFKTQNFTGETFYQTKNKVFTHFINWSKNQSIKKPNGKESTHVVGKTIEFD